MNRKKRLSNMKERINSLLMEASGLEASTQGIVDMVNKFENVGTSLKYVAESFVSKLLDGLKRLKASVVGHMESQDPSIRKMEPFIDSVVRKLGALTVSTAPIIIIVTMAMAFIGYIWAIAYFYNKATGLDFFNSVSKILTGGFDKMTNSFRSLMEELKGISSLKTFVTGVVKGTFKVFMLPSDFISGVISGVEDSKLASFTAELTYGISVCFGVITITMLTALGMSAALIGA